MRIEINGKPAAMTPRSLNWQENPIVAKDGQRAPIFGPYWGASLSIELPTDLGSLTFNEWAGIRDGTTQTFTLPHPITGALTTFTGVYVDSAVGRMDTSGDCAVMTGFDIVLSSILVTI